MNPTDLKIAIVVNAAWNIYNFRLGLIKKLQSYGIKVIAIAPPDEFVPKIQRAGCKFIPIHQLNRKGMNPFKDLGCIKELQNIYKKEKVDLALHFTIKPNIYGSIAAKLAGVKSINTITGLGYSFITEGILHKISKILYRYAFRQSNRVIFQNNDDKKLFLDEGLVSLNQTSLIKGSGINTQHFAPKNEKHTSSIYRFLFIGRLLYDKGIVEYVQAAAALKREYSNVEFHVVGALDKNNPSAITEAELNQWIEEGLIEYHGVTEDTRAFIEQSDAVVLPSYREGLPRVMLEGMAMAKPLITTDVPGCRDTVENGVNGFLVRPKDATHLAHALKQFMKLSSTEKKEMGRMGRMKALQEFDERLVVEDYSKLVFSVCQIPQPEVVPVSTEKVIFT